MSMNKCVYGISARIECLGGDVVVRSKPETIILLGRRLKIGWWLIMLGMKIAAEEYDYMTEEKQQEHVCKNCKWLSDDFTSVCVNDASDYLADFVMPEDGCPEWEGEDELHRAD